ncbi:MAG: KTSC domain-containing protein [Candidatus Doudnabacteria bacterium]
MSDKKYPKSNLIEWYHYHSLDNRLEVKTTDGKTWLFHNVSPHRIEEFESADSLGTYLQDHFMLDKNKYNGQEIYHDESHRSGIMGI